MSETTAAGSAEPTPVGASATPAGPPGTSAEAQGTAAQARATSEEAQATSADGPTRTPGAARRRSGAAELGLVALALGLVAATVLVAVGRLGPSGVTGVPAPDAVAAARQVAVDVTSLDYRKLDAEVAAVRRSSAGTFRDELERSRDALVKRLTAEQRVSSSRVLAAAVVSPGQEETLVLVALDENRQTKANAAGTAIRYRLQLRMHREDGRWLLTELRPVA